MKQEFKCFLQSIQESNVDLPFSFPKIFIIPNVQQLKEVRIVIRPVINNNTYIVSGSQFSFEMVLMLKEIFDSDTVIAISSEEPNNS